MYSERYSKTPAPKRNTKMSHTQDIKNRRLGLVKCPEQQQTGKTRKLQAETRH